MSVGSGYDIYCSQFSPDGTIFQVNYAAKAVENSGTALAMRGKDGVVFAVQKILPSKLLEEEASRRIYTLDNHVGLVGSGMLSDVRQLVQIGKDEAASYRATFGTPISVRELSSRIGNYVHAYTLHSALRPFGVGLMLGSWSEEEGPQLYSIDPSGHCVGYVGKAFGKQSCAATTIMEKLNLHKRTRKCEALLKEAAAIVYRLRKESSSELGQFRLELSWVTEETGGVHEMVPLEVFQEAQKYAQDSLSEASSSSDESEDEPAKKEK